MPSGQDDDAGWSELYEAPARLEMSFAHERLFAPQAYPVPRRAQRVPIVHVEALAMAAWFPVCWERRRNGPRLCVLRSLLKDAERAQPAGSPRNPASLPLALRSYPVAITPELGAGGAILVDRVVADRPGDVGAPFIMADGKPSRGLLHRYRTAMIVRHAAARADEITRALAEADAFRTWSLVFELGPRTTIAINDLLYVPPEAMEDGAVRDLLARFGMEAAVLLSAHRMSLFRINALLQAARKAAGSVAEAAATDEENDDVRTPSLIG